MTLIRSASKTLSGRSNLISGIIRNNRVSHPNQKLRSSSSSCRSNNNNESHHHHHDVSTQCFGPSSGCGGSPSPTGPNNASTSIQSRTFKTRSFQTTSNEKTQSTTNYKPGSRAFAECETNAIQDLFYQFANEGANGGGGVDDDGSYLNIEGVRELLTSIGEKPDDVNLENMFREMDKNNNGKLHLDEFLEGADRVLAGAPARIVIVVGGPGSGKGILCDRLAEECGVVHLSSGELLRDEVERGTPLGNEVAEIMERGELVSSAVITALIRRRTRKFPGRRILLDGFPRSVENAADFLDLMGKPELALHLDCDDTILMERIINRQRQGEERGTQRADDNIDTAIQRLRTYHKYHHSTMDWLRQQQVPIVNLDCSGSPENVWNQLLAIGRLMRPATQLSNVSENHPFFDDSSSRNTGT